MFISCKKFWKILLVCFYVLFLNVERKSKITKDFICRTNICNIIIYEIFNKIKPSGNSLQCMNYQVVKCNLILKEWKGDRKEKVSFLYSSWSGRKKERKNKNIRKRRHWPRVSATIAWKIWISRNRAGSIKFPTTTIRGICKCLFFLFYLDIVLSRSVRRVKPFPASYATASFILFPIKKNKPKVQREKTMSRRYIGVSGLLCLPSFSQSFHRNGIPSSTWN